MLLPCRHGSQWQARGAEALQGWELGTAQGVVSRVVGGGHAWVDQTLGGQAWGGHWHYRSGQGLWLGAAYPLSVQWGHDPFAGWRDDHPEVWLAAAQCHVSSGGRWRGLVHAFAKAVTAGCAEEARGAPGVHKTISCTASAGGPLRSSTGAYGPVQRGLSGGQHATVAQRGRTPSQSRPGGVHGVGVGHGHCHMHGEVLLG